MMNKDELIKIIDEEIGKWHNYYQQIDIHIYSIITSLFRAGIPIIPIDGQEVDKIKIFDSIAYAINNEMDDEKCLKIIGSLIAVAFPDIVSTYVDELNKEGQKKDAKLATLTYEAALDSITAELLARDNINTESLIALRTLQWVKDKIEQTKIETE